MRLVVAVSNALQKTPAMTLQDVAAMLAARPALAGDAARLKTAGPDLLNPAKGFDPDTLADAYANAIADSIYDREQRYLDEAKDLLADAYNYTHINTASKLRTVLAEADSLLARAERATKESLDDVWLAHAEPLKADEAGPDEVLRLNPKRGAWAIWFNDWLGTRGGLEPGQTFIIEGAAEAGKTSLAALLAVDAMAVGCPVLFWQLELRREETLEHLQAQHSDPAGWWEIPFWDRARRMLPDSYSLEVPRWPAADVETILAEMQNLVWKAEIQRGHPLTHACNGLLIVDYMQLLTVADKGPINSQHEVLATAASRLAKAAAESGVVLVLLSQLNKQDQLEGGTALQRMAHRVALLQKADADGNAFKPGGKPVAWDKDKGEARLLTWTKARGVRHSPECQRPDPSRVFWTGGRSRALHGGDADFGSAVVAMVEPT
jgi:hypothetical protein